MQYVSFLRGINVGGKSMIKMSELKEVFEKCGVSNVRTVINSGNVIFETDKTDNDQLTKKLEQAVEKKFAISSRIITLSRTQLKKVLAGIPSPWEKENKLRCYIAFLKTPHTADEVEQVVKLKDGVDSLDKGPGVVYMSTLLSGLTKSGFTKLVGTDIYQYLTIRNYTTVQKIERLMEQQ